MKLFFLLFHLGYTFENVDTDAEPPAVLLHWLLDK